MLRLLPLLEIFVSMAAWETLSPPPPLTRSQLIRRANNLGLTLLTTLLPRMGFPLTAIGVACTRNGSEQKFRGLDAVDRRMQALQHRTRKG